MKLCIFIGVLDRASIYCHYQLFTTKACLIITTVNNFRFFCVHKTKLP